MKKEDAQFQMRYNSRFCQNIINMVATPPLFQFISYFGVPEPRIKLRAALQQQDELPVGYVASLNGLRRHPKVGYVATLTQIATVPKFNMAACSSSDCRAHVYPYSTACKSPLKMFLVKRQWDESVPMRLRYARASHSSIPLWRIWRLRTLCRMAARPLGKTPQNNALYIEQAAKWKTRKLRQIHTYS